VKESGKTSDVASTLAKKDKKTKRNPVALTKRDKGGGGLKRGTLKRTTLQKANEKERWGQKSAKRERGEDPNVKSQGGKR